MLVALMGDIRLAILEDRFEQFATDFLEHWERII
jgi:queuine/archaeosine tRNA-ribosyltransferase